MASVVERTVATDRVAHIIRRVRRRWRARHALVGHHDIELTALDLLEGVSGVQGQTPF